MITDDETRGPCVSSLAPSACASKESDTPHLHRISTAMESDTPLPPHIYRECAPSWLCPPRHNQGPAGAGRWDPWRDWCPGSSGSRLVGGRKGGAGLLGIRQRGARHPAVTVCPRGGGRDSCGVRRVRFPGQPVSSSVIAQKRREKGPDPNLRYLVESLPGPVLSGCTFSLATDAGQ